MQRADPASGHAGRKPMRRGGIRSRIVTGLVLAAGFAALSIGSAVRFADLHFQTVLSNSMQPTFSAGDVVVTRAVPIGSVRVGDVIVFQPPARDEPVIHRVTSLRGGVVTTRGDANPVDDPWRVRLAGERHYRLVGVLRGIGMLTQLQRPLLALSGLVIGLVIVLELAKGVKTRAMRAMPHLDPRKTDRPDSSSFSSGETQTQ